jgi:hypothetical protein
MYEDIITDKKGPTYNSKNVTVQEFKVLFCTICELYEDCKFNAIEQCMKEYEEDK